MQRHIVPFLLVACLAVLTPGCDTVESDRPEMASASPSLLGGEPGAPSSYRDVRLVSICEGWWRIDNVTGAGHPSGAPASAQAFTWEHLGTGATGGGIVPVGGRVYVRTPHLESNPNTTKLFDGNGQQDDVKASNNSACPVLSGAVNAVADGSDDASAGAGIANVRVQAYFANGDPAGEATTDPDGRYSFALPATEYRVVVPETAAEAFNADLYAFYDPVGPTERVVALAASGTGGIDFGFDGDDGALVDELDRQNTSGQRSPWSQKDLRKAFDRARKNKPCHDAVLCREDLLEITRAIVDDPDLADDPYFLLSFPYVGPEADSDGAAYTDAELLEWGYEVLKDVPQGPQDPAQRLYSVVFACQINHLGGRGLENAALDLALQAYLEADVAANVPAALRAASEAGHRELHLRAGSGGGGTLDVARSYLGSGGGGTVDE